MASVSSCGSSVQTLRLQADFVRVNYSLLRHPLIDKISCIIIAWNSNLQTYIYILCRCSRGVAVYLEMPKVYQMVLFVDTGYPCGQESWQFLSSCSVVTREVLLSILRLADDICGHFRLMKHQWVEENRVLPMMSHSPCL